MSLQVESHLHDQIHLPDPARIADDINRSGFSVYKNAVAPSVVADLGRFWLTFFSASKADRKFVHELVDVLHLKPLLKGLKKPGTDPY